MRHAPLVVALVLATTLACASSFTTAKGDFRRGRFAEAKDALVLLEPDARAWTGQKRAEYVLYRGLVHHALGDRTEAGVWLREAKAIEDVHPGTLGGDDRVRLELALEAITPLP